MEPNNKDKKITEVLKYLAALRDKEGPAQTVEVYKIWHAIENSKEDDHFIHWLMEMDKAGWIKSNYQQMDITPIGYSAVAEYTDSKIRITSKGMARLRPDDSLYSEYAEKAEDSPGFWYRIVHEWLREILIAVISGAAGAAVAWYLTKS